MSDIPEDIRAAAADVASASGWTGFKARAVASIIARALLAERNATEARTIERCAKVRDMLVAALRDQFCPRPCNNRPDQFDVGDCVDAGECGCSAANALAAAIRSQAASHQKMDALDKAIICDLIPKTYRVEE